MAASIFVCCSGVRFRLASETVQAGFEALPTFFVQSPCSPANTAPVANIPATTNAIILVIVQRETVNYPMSFNHLLQYAATFLPRRAWFVPPKMSPGPAENNSGARYKVSGVAREA